MVEARVQGGNRSSGISKRVTLIQESGYNSNERARGDKGRDSCRRNRREEMVVAEGKKEETAVEETKGSACVLSRFDHVGLFATYGP